MASVSLWDSLPAGWLLAIQSLVRGGSRLARTGGKHGTRCKDGSQG
jgi:hypothetical protein